MNCTYFFQFVISLNAVYSSFNKTLAYFDPTCFVSKHQRNFFQVIEDSSITSSWGMTTWTSPWKSLRPGRYFAWLMKKMNILGQNLWDQNLSRQNKLDKKPMQFLTLLFYNNTVLHSYLYSCNYLYRLLRKKHFFHLQHQLFISYIYSLLILSRWLINKKADFWN